MNWVHECVRACAATAVLRAAVGWSPAAKLWHVHTLLTTRSTQGVAGDAPDPTGRFNPFPTLIHPDPLRGD